MTSIPESKTVGTKEILKKSWWLILLFWAVIGGLYFNAFKGDFVSDDYATIAQNPNIKSLDIGKNWLISPHVTNTLIAYFFEVEPIYYHSFSILLFAITTTVGFVLAYKLFSQWIAVVGTILFLAHPIHVEAVSWISGKPYLFIALYQFILLLLFIKFLETKSWKYLPLLALFGFIAFMSDVPRMFTFFALAPMIVWLRGYTVNRVLVKKMMMVLLVAGTILALLAWPSIETRIAAVNGGINNSGSLFYNPFFQYPTGLSKYFQLLTVPIDLTLYHTMYVFPVWLNWLILLNYLGLVGYFWVRGNKSITFLLLMVLVAILPSMAPVKVSWLVAERYAFLASWAWCLFLAYLAYYLWKNNRILTGVTIAVLFGVWSVRLVMRNIDWQTNHNLWVNTCQVSPNSHNAWNNIGDDYDKLKDYPNAVKGFTQSVLVKPNYADAYHNRANILFKTGRMDLAREMYETGLRFSPQLFQSYISLVQIDLMEKRLQDALAHTEALVKVEPNNPQSWYIAGIVFDNMGDKNKALEMVKKSLTINPNFEPSKQLYLNLVGSVGISQAN